MVLLLLFGLRHCAMWMGLELAREGKIKLRQSGPFGPIYLKPAGPGAKAKSAGNPEPVNP